MCGARGGACCARAGAREPASCGLSAVCFALSRKCHARDYSAVGCGDERDLSERCDDDGRGEGNRGWWLGRAVRASDIGLWCAASFIRLSDVARCGRGGMRDARRSTRTQEIHSTGPDYAELRITAERSRRRCCRARTMRYAIAPRPRPSVRTQRPHRLRPLRSADHESIRATHIATRRTRERKSGCSRHGNSVRFGRRIEKCVCAASAATQDAAAAATSAASVSASRKRVRHQCTSVLRTIAISALWRWRRSSSGIVSAR